MPIVKREEMRRARREYFGDTREARFVEPRLRGWVVGSAWVACKMQKVRFVVFGWWGISW